MDISQYITELYDLWFEAQSNESNPDYEELEQFIYSYDLGFSLAMLVKLDYVDSSTLPQKSIDEVLYTWNTALQEGFLG
jgi:hypothetical protein